MMEGQINQVLLACIAGALGFCCKILYNSLGTLQELNMKIGVVVEQVKDHEQRLRVVEKQKRS